MTDFPKYDSIERANALTHGAGFLASLLGLYFLAQKGWSTGERHIAVGLIIFGASLVVLYLASTLYHSVPFYKVRRRAILRRLDHIAIYFLIAGTHTPFILQFLEGGKAVFYLSLIWGMVALGLIFKLFFFGKYEWLSVLFYVVMGWSGIVTVPQMTDELSSVSVWWIFIGGLFYTAGVFFYVREQMRWHHVIWHLFVLAGSAAHFWAVWLSVG